MGLRDWFGAHERTSVGIAVILVLVANLLALGFMFNLFGGSHYDNIAVTYQTDPNGILVTEKLVQTTSPSDSFRVLYRSFDNSICFSDCSIKIVSVECARSTPYVSLPGYGNVFDPRTQTLPQLDSDLRTRIHSNEVGCYGSGFAGTTETMTIKYFVAQDLVAQHNYAHSLFSNNHLAILALDTQGTSGSDSAHYIPANGAIAIDTRSGAVHTSSSFLIALLISVCATLLPLAIFFWFGIDRNDVVPQYLHTVPNSKREAWEVDILVNGNNTISSDGVGAIILSLYMKGAATVDVDKGLLTQKLTVTVQKKPREALTDTEKSLLEVLCDTKEEETSTYTRYSYYPKVNQSSMQAFLKNDTVQKLHKTLYNYTGRTLIVLIPVAGWILASVLRSSSYEPLFITNIICFFIISATFPPSVFGRFKDDYHKEYLEWIAFENMLTDYAQIQRYLKEDANMWKQWIVYATALGAADKLLASMKELKLLDPKEYEQVSHMHSAAVLFAASSVSTSSSGGGGGGGGFGGGGGGGR